MSDKGLGKMSIQKSIAYAMSLLWKADKKVVFLNYYKEITERIFVSFFSIYLIQYTYECIENDVAFPSLIRAVVLMCLGHIVIHCNSAYTDYCNRARQPIVYKYVFLKVIEKAQKIELVQYEQPDFYNKFSRALDECLDQLMNGLITFTRAIGFFLAFLTGLYMMWRVDPILSVICFVAAVGTVYFSLKKNKYHVELRVAETKERRVMDYIKRVMYEKKYAGELRLYPIKKVLFQKFDENNKSRCEIQKKYYRKIALYQTLEKAVCINLALVGTYLYTNYVIKVQGTGSAASYIAMISAIGTVTYYLRETLENFDEAGRNCGYMINLKEFLEYEVERKELGEKKVTETLGDLSFEHVTFSYEGSKKPVIQDLSLHIKKGEKIALVGENGAGKTTLMKLLMGLYPVTQGKILVNQVPVNEYDPQDYHDHFGAVFQDFQIFGLTLGENVLMREPRSDEEKDLVIESLQRAQFEDVLEKMPNGIQSILTKEFAKDGFVCSGGQGQKVAIARVFAKDPDIVILDEPSSALDPIAEFNMYQNMLEASFGKTVFFISHRMSSARIADRIVYMERGTVVEQGTHEELMSKNGKYARMFELQARNYQNEAEVPQYEG